MDHITAIISQLAQGFFETIGNGLLRSVRGRGLVKSDAEGSRGPGLRFGFQLRLLHRPARLDERPRQLAVYRIDLRAQPRRTSKIA